MRLTRQSLNSGLLHIWLNNGQLTHCFWCDQSSACSLRPFGHVPPLVNECDPDDIQVVNCFQILYIRSLNTIQLQLGAPHVGCELLSDFVYSFFEHNITTPEDNDGLL